MSEALDISMFHDMYTEQSLVDEATRPDTVRKGNYNGKVVSVELRPAGEKSPFPGRPMLNYRVSMAAGDKAVTKFVEVSPIPYRTQTVAGQRTSIAPDDAEYSKEYPLDTASKLWAQLSKIVNPDGKLSVADVIKESVDRTFSFFVSEGFKDDEGKNHYYKDEDERKELVKAGYTPRNYINTISKVKE